MPDSDLPDPSCTMLRPDEGMAAIGMGDGTIEIVDVQRSLVLLRARGHADSVEDLDLAPHAGVVVSASRDNTVRVWPLDLQGVLERAAALAVQDPAVAAALKDAFR
jgi:WD40 repeat protein